MIVENETQLVFSSKGNGKLLLSGEYLVLKGASALSLPLKLGQSLKVYKHSGSGFTWQAHHPKGVWNTVKFDEDFHIIEASDASFAQQLKKIISCALQMSAMSKLDLRGLKAVTQMDFMPEWGLGSSSTLVYNLALFFKVDPYLLLSDIFQGSGYDIAAAGCSQPILFKLDNGKPTFHEISFSPPFSENIYFIYTNKKQSSQSSVQGFSHKIIEEEQIRRVSEISVEMASCNRIDQFQLLMNEHEGIISAILGETPVQQKHFSDFNGCIKSLGAWGGDFVMAVSQESPDYVKDYFERKNFNIIYTLPQLALNDCK